MDAMKPAATAAAALLGLTIGLAQAAPLTVADVGDPESFGRNVTYLGFAQTISIDLQDDCSSTPPEESRCSTPAPQPATTIVTEADLAHINLPAKATKSLLCFGFTPFITYQLRNNTAASGDGMLRGTATITIENSLLDDPALINLTTGQPFGGRIATTLSADYEVDSLQPGEGKFKRASSTRMCIGGVVSTRSLVEAYGLTEAQAAEFFKRPMTLRFGARVIGQYVEFGQFFYGMRLYGD